MFLLCHAIIRTMAKLLLFLLSPSLSILLLISALLDLLILRAQTLLLSNFSILSIYCYYNIFFGLFIVFDNYYCQKCSPCSFFLIIIIINCISNQERERERKDWRENDTKFTWCKIYYNTEIKLKLNLLETRGPLLSCPRYKAKIVCKKIMLAWLVDFIYFYYQ